MDFLMGSIMQFGGNFAPRDWAYCQGQLIAISQNQALFAILGTTWGGDGRTNYGLPDLKGRVAVGIGQGTGLTPVYQARGFGTETTTIAIGQMPAHTHAATFTPTTSAGDTTVTVHAHNGNGDSDDANGNYWATGGQPVGISGVSSNIKGYSTTTDTEMASGAVTVSGGSGITGGDVTVAATGGSTGVSIMQPSMGLSSIICLQGTFPSRN